MITPTFISSSISSSTGYFANSSDISTTMRPSWVAPSSSSSDSITTTLLIRIEQLAQCAKSQGENLEVSIPKMI